MGLIEADSEVAWPEAMLKTLSDHADEIAAYQVERTRIDRAAEEDVALRIHRPANPHRTAWDAVLEISEAEVAGRYLTGLHATRLTDDEREDIALNGLRVLSPDLR